MYDFREKSRNSIQAKHFQTTMYNDVKISTSKPMLGNRPKTENDTAYRREGKHGGDNRNNKSLQVKRKEEKQDKKKEISKISVTLFCNKDTYVHFTGNFCMGI